MTPLPEKTLLPEQSSFSEQTPLSENRSFSEQSLHVRRVNPQDTVTQVAVLNAIVQAGLDGLIFHDVHTFERRDWLSLMVQARLYVAERPVAQSQASPVVVGACWIQPFSRRAGLAHFCIIDVSMARVMGLELIRQVRAQGDFDSLMGLTPAPYRHALRFISHLGFSLLGKVPGACHLAQRNRDVDGIVSVLDLRADAL